MLIRSIILSVAATSLASCESNFKIVSAFARSYDSGQVNVSIEVPKEAASIIKNKQYYFSIILNECRQGEGGFPIEAYAGKERATKFDFSVNENPVIFTGSIPNEIFSRYGKPCVHLRGGGYITGKFKTNIVPVVRKDIN